MSERLGSPEPGQSNPNRLFLESARSVAYEMLHNAEDLLSREIAEKILAKVEIKDRVDSLTSHADDVTVYQEFKKLGIFVVRDTRATFDYEDKEGGLSLRKGDQYLDLHLPPVPKGSRSRDAVHASLALVCEYISAQGLNPKYLIGVTYERMARLAERQFGFSVAYPDPDLLPASVVRGVEQVYEGFTQAGRSGQDLGLPAIVFQEISPIAESKAGSTNPVVVSLGRFALGDLGQR
ncbi:MAG TPA: hypothetical protein VF733_04505 [Candidatus Saccharimonadales bacterium]